MFLSGLFITMLYSVSYLAFAITAKLDRKPPIVMNSYRDLHSSLFLSINKHDNSTRHFSDFMTTQK